MRRAETERSRWHRYTKCLARSIPTAVGRFAPVDFGLFYNSRRTSVFFHGMLRFTKFPTTLSFEFFILLARTKESIDPC
jgi:hypothetical protein